MNVILFDDIDRVHLLPLTFTRPSAEIRVGITTIKEKWERVLQTKTSYLTEEYLSEKYSLKKTSVNLLVNGSVLPDTNIVQAIKQLKTDEVLVKGDITIAAHVTESAFDKIRQKELQGLKLVEYNDIFDIIKYPWNIFSLNGKAMDADFEALTKGRKSQPLSNTNRVLAPEKIFLEEGAVAEFSILNASTGPIYIGKYAEIMEGSVVRGGLALCEHAALKLSTKVYGPTTLGPHCKVGGEINNSVLIGYSNKGHDGFLGNSVLGEWCNLGADTNNSNLKNNYEEVKVWNYQKEGFVKTGLQFCGLIMGDHSKCGINTMFNTGTVVGVSANVFGAGFPRNFIPSFSWGGAQGMETYAINKAFQTAEKVFERRGMVFDNIEKNILTQVFNLTEKYRRF